MATQVIPLAPQQEQPQPNMFANWNKAMDKTGTPAEQFVSGQMQQMNIPDPNTPQQQNVVPYAPQTTVAQPVVQQAPKPAPTTQTATKTTRRVDASDPNAGMEALLYTSPEQEEKYRKASVQRQRIMAIGDALRHIGNIYNTVNYAPSQQFNNPAEDERRRYLGEKAIRDANNYKYMTYQQAKQAQEAKMRQWEADYKLKVADAARKAGYTEAQIKAMQDRIANQKAYHEASLAYKRENDEANRKQRQAQYDKQNKFTQQRIGIAATNSRNAENYRQWKMKNGGGSGGKGQNTIYSRRGYLTKQGATDHDLKSIYDNMYEWGKNKYYKGSDGKLHPYIDEGGILSGIAPDILGGKKISDASKREAVNKMLMEHDDAAVQLHTKHGFDWHEQTPYDPYGKYAVDSPDVDDDEDEDFESYAR